MPANTITAARQDPEQGPRAHGDGHGPAGRAGAGQEQRRQWKGQRPRQGCLGCSGCRREREAPLAKIQRRLAQMFLMRSYPAGLQRPA
ncbi:hypothetical protein LZ31DRAFT_13251 [Colletotrichum somersetense]|nr:hypothetical protein LZ31DRAFT_13251 [Colletotrichum somersetense]